MNSSREKKNMTGIWVEKKWKIKNQILNIGLLSIYLNINKKLSLL